MAVSMKGVGRQLAIFYQSRCSKATNEGKNKDRKLILSLDGLLLPTAQPQGIGNLRLWFNPITITPYFMPFLDLIRS